MRTRILGAALAALVIMLLAVPARCDVVDLTDGKAKIRLPKDVETPWGMVPTDAELRDSGTGNLKMAYDEASLGRQRFPAAQIVEIYLTAAYANTPFNNGENYGRSGYWNEAAEAFRQAATELEGASKQWALYKRMIATTSTGNDRAVLQAANDVLASDPKTYYFGPAQELRARLFAKNGQMKDAIATLQKVIDAEGMNVRDYFSAKYLQTWLTKSVPAMSANSADAWKEAVQAYDALLLELKNHRNSELASVPRFKMLMSKGEALRSLGQREPALKIFDEIIANANESTDKTVLAGVYYGLGDLVYDEATTMQAKSTSSTSKEKVKALLDQAALHYLRVILLYGDYADSRDRFGATRGAARVFKDIFHLSGDKDCDAAHKSYKYYRDAVQMMDQGEEKRLLYNEALALKDQMNASCGVPGENPSAKDKDKEEKDGSGSR